MTEQKASYDSDLGCCHVWYMACACICFDYYQALPIKAQLCDLQAWRR